jgi:hypothetical protein
MVAFTVQIASQPRRTWSARKDWCDAWRVRRGRSTSLGNEVEIWQGETISSSETRAQPMKSLSLEQDHAR